MNFTVNSTALAQELRLLNHVVQQKPALPILLNVLITASELGLTLYTTDLEIGFRTTCDAAVVEQGIVALPAKRLLDLIEQLPNADVQITTDKTHVRLISGAFRSRLQIMPVEDFPTMPLLEGEPTLLSTIQVQQMINRVHYAITDKSKHVVNGALLSLTENVMSFVATDGKRLAVASLPRMAGEMINVILPIKTLDALLALFSTGTIAFSQSDRLLFFSSEDRLLTSRMLETTFPAYQRIIPRDNDKHAVVDRAKLAAILRRVGLMSENNQAVYLSFEGAYLQVTSSSLEAGDALEELPIVYEGTSLKLCINWRYVLDFLEAATSAQIEIDFKASTTSVKLSDGDFMNVIMTMRA